MVRFGKAIEKFRVATGLSRPQLAKKIDVAPNYIWLLEKDKREPSFTVLRKIASTLKVPIEVLFWEGVDADRTMSAQDQKIIKAVKKITSRFSYP